MSTITTENAREALAQVAETLAYDDYLLEVSVREDRLTLRIEAGSEACEDCLAPENVVAGIARAALKENGVDEPAAGIEVIYPTDVHH